MYNRRFGDNTPDIDKNYPSLDKHSKSKPLAHEDVEYLASSDLLTEKEMKDIFDKMKELTDKWK